MSEEQFKHWRINQGGQALLDAMNSGEISASLFAKQVWQAALSSQSAKSVLARPIDTMTGEVLWGLAKDHFKMSPVAPTEVYKFSYALADMLSSPQPSDDRVRELIASDHYASGFQSISQYRNGLLKSIASMSSGEQK